MFFSNLAEITLKLSKKDIAFLNNQKFCENFCYSIHINGKDRYVIYLGKNVDDLIFKRDLEFAKQQKISSKLIASIKEAKENDCSYLLILNDNYKVL